MTDQVRYPQEGSTGAESDWKQFGCIDISSGRLMVGDFSFIPFEDHCLVVAVAPGRFILTAKLIAYADDHRISRLRVLRESSESAAQAERIGETWTDTGRTGVCDYEVYKEAFFRLGVEDNWEQYMGEAENVTSEGVVILDETTDAGMIFVPSGFGDGSYPVFALRRDDELMGLEIEFIAADEPYPFST